MCAYIKKDLKLLPKKYQELSNLGCHELNNSANQNHPVLLSVHLVELRSTSEAAENNKSIKQGI